MEFEFDEIPLRYTIDSPHYEDAPVIGWSMVDGKAHLSPDIDGDWHIERITVRTDHDWRRGDNQLLPQSIEIKGDQFRDLRDFLNHKYADTIEDIKARYDNAARDGMDQWKDESGYHEVA